MIKYLGKVVSNFQENSLRWLVCLLGDIIYYLPTRRRQTLLSNLHHAFPEKPISWHKRIAKESCRQTVQMGLFVLISSFWNRKKINKHFKLSEDFKKCLAKEADSQKGALVLVPHFSMMEAITLFSACYDGKAPHIGVIYRPFFNETIEKWVKKTRERFGIELLSRKGGFNRAMTILKEGGVVAILFDQNAGNQGTLSLFFERLVSSTILPNLLYEKYEPTVYMVYTRPEGFLKAKLEAEVLTGVDYGVMKRANEWLESMLKESDEMCSDWLWLHSRWRTQDEAARRFRLQIKRDNVDSLGTLPRRSRFWIRMPNWLGDIVMAIPLILALRQSRPDAEITLIVKRAYAEFLNQLKIAEKIIEVEGCWKDLKFFWRARHLYSDTYVLLTNSFRGDLEAFLTRAPQRFGMQRPGKRRPFLTHRWKRPRDLDEKVIHQTLLLEKLFRHFGLNKQLPLTPLAFAGQAIKKTEKIGLICGSENASEKRWPIKNWQYLIRQGVAKGFRFVLFGTPKDAEITRRVSEPFSKDGMVEDRAGKTSLVEFAREIVACRLVVCNDTGGMHLASLLGVPLIALFGPTNPLRTGPIFEGKKAIVQPKGCPAIGGSRMDKIDPEKVFKCVMEVLKEI